ncbi:MAG TPA: tetratricopeptide repeat protein [Burkholderiaceae bacterium]|nr:tetratricopeptide repeat protein [Burkholderiaceae bacterium]
MAIDVTPLWNFSQPELSEQRFRDALQTASGDDALILQTQIARSYGLRKDFATARTLLRDIEPQIAQAGPEARVRYFLELGRTYASATHAPEQMTQQDRDLARAAYRRALDEARAARLDNLAIDAIHMFAFIDTAPAEQLEWGLQALAVVEASTQPAAKRWEASIRNNIGYALHRLGRYEEALQQFRLALELRERSTDADATRAAHWMIAWTLRAMGKAEEALQIQLRLEREADAAGRPDRYVFEELEALYQAAGDTERAQFYRQRREALSQKSPGG